ncbi:MAG: hypothetical protein DMF84_26675 [Acidobacteria bacterium]|nr:MAG: hypothetical protein DMF84_26675 [Acidobacteriota bacterium]
MRASGEIDSSRDFLWRADYNPIVGFEKLAEMKIREAIDAGEFDHLPNAGARLDLEPYFAIPEHLRMGYFVL